METKVCSLLVICFIFGTAFSQSSNSLDFEDVQKQLKINGGPDIKQIEKTLEENGVSLPDLNSTKIDLDKVENVLKEKCEKQGASGAVESLKDFKTATDKFAETSSDFKTATDKFAETSSEQQDQIKECVTSKVDFAQMQDELEEAKKTGSMDEVFAKYCKKWPEVYACVENATATVRSCMSQREQKAFNKSLDIVQELQEFMCFKDGDRLAMFVAEGGIECVQEQQEGIKNCVNTTIGGRIPEPSDLSVDSIPIFLFSEEDCQDFDEIRHCVNVELEKCTDTTPANIVDAFFKFLKKQMPCGKKAESAGRAAPVSEADSSASSIVNSVLVTLGLFFLVKFH